MNALTTIVSTTPRRPVLPIAVYPGASITGVTVRDIVTRACAQADASLALQRRFQTPCVLTAMDLSVESEAFGATIVMSDDEIPTVTGRLVTSLEHARALAVPAPDAGRCPVYLETVRLLKQAAPGVPVLAGCIGPFSLAGRLAGLSEALELTLSEPELMHALLEKSTAFLTAYVQTFRAAGADGIIMAEPGAGLLSPRSMSEFSSRYIARIVGALPADFAFVLHNCAAKLLHLPAVLESGARIFHFGAPMDLPAALAKVPAGVILCGNLDPSAVFNQSSPEEVAQRTRALLEATAAHRHFILSSGCDVPPSAPLGNLDAFFAAARS